MLYRGDPIAETLDKIAEASGMPRLSRKLERALPMRFKLIPLALLAMAVAGMWVQIGVSQAFGYILVMLSWMFSLSLQQFSPLRAVERRRLDEHERAVFRSGHFIGLIAGLGMAVLGCLAIGICSIANMVRLGSFWEPSGVDWIALAMFLLAVESNVAVFAASSAMPDPLDDDGETSDE